MIRLIGETRTQTGLKVQCALQTKDYPTGRKVTNQEMASLNLREHAVLPDWNYTLLPRETRNWFLHVR